MLSETPPGSERRSRDLNGDKRRWRARGAVGLITIAPAPTSRHALGEDDRFATGDDHLVEPGAPRHRRGAVRSSDGERQSRRPFVERDARGLVLGEAAARLTAAGYRFSRHQGDAQSGRVIAFRPNVIASCRAPIQRRSRICAVRPSRPYGIRETGPPIRREPTAQHGARTMPRSHLSRSRGHEPAKTGPAPILPRRGREEKGLLGAHSGGNRGGNGRDSGVISNAAPDIDFAMSPRSAPNSTMAHRRAGSGEEGAARARPAAEEGCNPIDINGSSEESPRCLITVRQRRRRALSQFPSHRYTAGHDLSQSSTGRRGRFAN